MAFDKKSLNIGAYNGAAPRLHYYTTTDAIADVNTEGYFNDAADSLNVRDVIIVTDTATPTTHFVTVLSISGAGVVDVSNGLAITETDSD